MKRGWWDSCHMKTGGPFEEKKGPKEEYMCIDVAAGDRNEEEQRLAVYAIMKLSTFHANLKKLIERKETIHAFPSGGLCLSGRV